MTHSAHAESFEINENKSDDGTLSCQINKFMKICFAGTRVGGSHVFPSWIRKQRVRGMKSRGACYVIFVP